MNTLRQYQTPLQRYIAMMNLQVVPVYPFYSYMKKKLVMASVIDMR
jgi:hypothetical protein